MRDIYIVGGPTGSGKTNFAIKLAKKHNAELINADSRQVYKYLDIGTNKGDLYKINDELSNNGTFLINKEHNIPIHLINFINPDIKFSVFDFYKLASSTIKDIFKRNKDVVIVGGTGLYIDSLIKGYNYSNTIKDKLSNKSLNSLEVDINNCFKELNTNDIREIENLNLNTIQEILKKYIPKTFNNLNNSEKNNKRRLVRLIEKIIKQDINLNNTNIFKYNKFYYPIFNLTDLKIKIVNRVDQMFKDGLVSEVENVLNMGYNPESVALKGIGYKEVVMCLNKEISLDTCIDLVKKSHVKYAKRQITWFEGRGRGYILEKVKFQ